VSHRKRDSRIDGRGEMTSPLEEAPGKKKSNAICEGREKPKGFHHARYSENERKMGGRRRTWGFAGTPDDITLGQRIILNARKHFQAVWRVEPFSTLD